MRVLADSHVVFWSVIKRHLLSTEAQNALAEAERTDGIAISVITLFDLWYSTQKAGPSRIEPTQLDAVLNVVEGDEANVEMLMVTRRTADHVGCVSRDDLKDPFDRLIVATALEHNLPLVTADKRIADLGIVEVIW